MLKKISSLILGLGLLGLASGANAVPVTFSKLSGITGGSIAGTAVYKADLSSVGFDIAALTVRDNSFGLGGATGVFSGFDLDAIILSNTDCGTAACAGGLTGLSVFDYVNNSIFTPGAQRAPVGPKLFGTDSLGTAVDNVVATLGAFDGESTTSSAADGFLSMGDGGVLSFNLTSLVSTAGLYLYIGEVGDNGEVAAGSIEVFSSAVPEPGTIALLGLGLAAITVRRKGG